MNVKIVEYRGNSKGNGKPVGHSLNVLKSYYNLIKKDIDTELVMPKNFIEYCNDLDLDNKFTLKFNHIYNSENKLSRFFKSHINLLKVFIRTDSDDLLWFINPDISLFLFLLIWPFKRKIVLSIYKNDFVNTDKKLKRSLITAIFNKAIKKINGGIVTNENINIQIPKKIYVPDYIYDEKFRDLVKKSKKKEQVVCLGLMNKEKNLEELISVFNNKNHNLLIVGHFQDQSYYNYIKSLNKSSKVIIKNEYLSDEYYYSCIAESKYIILPYDKKSYKDRTSGVLIESAFLNTVPIAPNFLLNYNRFEGIGYDELTELTELKLFNSFENEILSNNNKRIEKEFDENVIRRKIVSFLECLSD